MRITSHLTFSSNSTDEEALGGEEKFYPPAPVKTLSDLKVFSKDEVADKIALSELLAESPDKHDLINFTFGILCDVLAKKSKSDYIWANKSSRSFKEVYDAFALITKKHVEYVIYSCLKNDNLAKAHNPKFYIKAALVRSNLTIDNFDSRKFEKTAVIAKSNGVPEGFRTCIHRANINGFS